MAMTSPASSPETPKERSNVLGALARGLDAVSGPPTSAPASQNPYLTPVAVGATQAEALQNAIAACAMRGWRLTAVHGGMATMVSGQPINHVLYLLLTVFTLGLGAIIWLIVALTNDGEKYLTIIADTEGNITYREGR